MKPALIRTFRLALIDMSVPAAAQNGQYISLLLPIFIFIFVRHRFILTMEEKTTASNGTTDFHFNQAELTLLKEGLKRSHKERFEMATRLYKIQRTMNKATISHKPFISK